MSNKIFISHAVADKDLVDAFVDLLQTGANISTTDIFCSSLEGMGIPPGKNFIEFIKDKLQDPKVVIVFLTQNYLESQFCQCELGASWILSTAIIPIIVEPLSFNDVKAVLTGTQCVQIKDKLKLTEAIIELNKIIGNRKYNSARWEVKRDKFLEKIDDILSTIVPPSNVSRKEFDDLNAHYDDAKTLIETQDEEIRRLNGVIEKIRDATDKKSVDDAILASLPEKEQYESLLEKTKSCLNKNKTVVNYALYEYVRGNNICVNNYVEQKELADDADEAVKDDFLSRNDNDYSLNENDPLISSSLSVVNELDEFMSNMSEGMYSILTEKYGFVPSIENRRFWEDVLGQRIRY